MNSLVAKISNDIDTLMDNAIQVSREIRKLNLQEKEKKATINNIKKVIENLLVAHKRISKGEKIK
jgi:hypothetical protein